MCFWFVGGVRGGVLKNEVFWVFFGGCMCFCVVGFEVAMMAIAIAVNHCNQEYNV